jgi:hypothetical protein
VFYDRRMPFLASALLGALLLAAADTAWVALFRAAPAGRFRVLVDDGTTFTFATTTGRFSVDRAARVLTYAAGKRRGRLGFDEMKGLEYRVDSQWAVLQEIFFGWDATDWMAPYRDTVDWFALAVVTNDGQRLPLYLAGRYAPREFMLTWYIDLQSALLEKLRLAHDVEARSRDAVALLLRRMEPLRLV